jgi:putative phosphoesterase
VTQHPQRRTAFTVGVISDTHGVVSDAALAALVGCDAIVHAGDVGDGWVLDLLAAVAPVTAVRGNDDYGALRYRLPEIENVTLGGVRFLVAHKEEHLVGVADPASAGARVAVTGHTHVCLVEERDGVLFVNPGSASRPKTGGDATVVVVRIDEAGVISSEVVPLG